MMLINFNLTFFDFLTSKSFQLCTLENKRTTIHYNKLKTR